MSILASIIFTILITNSYTVPYCIPKDYCMACNATTKNVCDACFNWGSGILYPRYVLDSTCRNLMAKTKVQGKLLFLYYKTNF